MIGMFPAGGAAVDEMLHYGAHGHSESGTEEAGGDAMDGTETKADSRKDWVNDVCVKWCEKNAEERIQIDKEVVWQTA